jgi:mono/diheme cytochrome c family protein
VIATVALTTQEGIGFAIAAIVVVLFFLGLAYVAQGRARRRREARGRPDIPPAMQPAPTDAELEKPRLEKLQGWALASIIFLAVWIPVVWLEEPSQNEHQTTTITQESIARGAKEIQLFSETNIFGVGCVRCHGPNVAGGHNLFNGKAIATPDLQTVCGGPNTGHPLIHNIVDVRNTIMQGRTGTDMPSWSVRYAGGLDDQQVQDLVDYLVSVNLQHVPFKDNVCINPKAKGYVQPVVAAQ